MNSTLFGRNVLAGSGCVNLERRGARSRAALGSFSQGRRGTKISGGASGTWRVGDCKPSADESRRCFDVGGPHVTRWRQAALCFVAVALIVPVAPSRRESGQPPGDP